MKLTHSIAFKNAILYLLIFLLGLSTLGYLLLSNSSNRIVDTAKNQLRHNGQLIEVHIRDYIGDLISYLDYLTSSPILTQYLQDKSLTNYQLVAKNYLSLLESNEDFSQIRFIAAPDGNEVIRVEKLGNTSTVIKNENLQNKHDRPYFLESVKLKQQDIYFSPIDLNKEFGKISMPRMPTLRIARPIFERDLLKGVIVINTDLTKLFSRLNKIVGKDYVLQLFNENGFYLMHEHPDSTFVFEYGQRKPQVSIDNSTFENDIISKPGVIMSRRRIMVDKMDYHFNYQVLANRNVLMDAYYNWRNSSILLILLIGIVFTLIAFLILNKQAQALRRFTDKMKKFSEKREFEQLPKYKNDEIGELAKGFEDMATIINNQIDSINSEKLKAEKAVQEKTEFIENISHEIRNPLHAIMGLSTMLENNQPNANQIEILNSLKFNTTNLLGLVNNILDYQNVIKGQINVIYTMNNIPHLVNEVIMGNMYMAVQKSIHLFATFDDNLYKYDFKTDKLRLSQILGNLISNALKFTPKKGFVEVIVSIAHLNGATYVKFIVKDNGMGMDTEELEKIKERYFTNPGAQLLSSNHGLGLTIVSELLNLFNSKLQIRSKKNEGSEFEFTLQVESRPSVQRRKLKNDLDLTDLNVLIVEDDPQIVSLYKHMLNDSGANVVCFADYDSIVNIPSSCDLLISDFRFPKYTILDKVPTLNQIINENSGLIIASATTPNFDPIKKAYHNVAFIRKPFSYDDFKEVIIKVLITSKYGFPQTEEIKKDYDYQKEKYNKALNLLTTEWESSTKRILGALENNDKHTLEEVLHKLITTIRRLQLIGLEKYLLSLQDAMPLEKKKQNEVVSKVEFIMNGYAHIIKNSN